MANITEGLPMLLTINQAKHELNCSRTHIWALTKRGQLDVVRHGRFVRITRRSLLAYVAKNTHRAPSREAQP